MTGFQRERFAIKSLLHTLNDRDAVFFIKDKAPDSLDEACSLFERYEALTNTDNRRPIAAKTVSQSAEATFSSAVTEDLYLVRKRYVSAERSNRTSVRQNC